MSCKGLTGTPLKNCKAKALKKAKAQAYELLKKRHPNMTKNDTLLVNRSLSKTANLGNFTNKKIAAAVALRLKEKGLKNLKGKTAEVNLIGTSVAKSRKTTVKTTPRKKAILKKNRKPKKEEYVSTAVFNKKDLASKVTIKNKKKPTTTKKTTTTNKPTTTKKTTTTNKPTTTKKKPTILQRVGKKIGIEKKSEAQKKRIAQNKANQKKAKNIRRSRRRGLDRNARN